MSQAISARDLEGKRITRLFFRMTEYTVDVTAPDERHLLNFWVEVGKVRLLVLDPYGDDTLPDEIRERVFGKAPYTIAIDTKTGGICKVTAYTREDGVELYVEPVNGADTPRIPPRWRHRLPELATQKRPYRCHIDPHTLEQFIDREASYRDVGANVVFSFDFYGDGMLEVWGDHYRKVSRWQLNHKVSRWR